VAELSRQKAVLQVIGSGASFPFLFSPTGRVKSVQTADGIAKINQSIHLILSTRIGERVMMPEFGSRLYTLVFEPNDSVLAARLEFETGGALRRWEKRIRVTRMEVLSPEAASTEELVTLGADPQEISRVQGDHWIGIYIEYEILQFHTQGSYVYPFVREPMPMSETVGRSR
jgi:phage baseplate assembly protein W